MKWSAVVDATDRLHSVVVGMVIVALILAICFLATLNSDGGNGHWTVYDSHGNVYHKLKKTSGGFTTIFEDANGREYVFKGTHSYVEEQADR